MIEISRLYRRVLSEGMSGHEIWALQLNLNGATNAGLATDGDFGPKTKSAVVAFQKNQGLTADGIAGILTQRSLATKFFNAPETTFRLPRGLLYGITEGESGFALGATNFTVAGGVDLGWLQRRVTDANWNEENITNAFDGRESMNFAAERLRTWKQRYASQPGIVSTEAAWRNSVLRWNWPSAAEHFADGTIKTWQYRESWTDSNGVNHTALRYMKDPAMWIKAIGVPNVETGFQWAEHYVSSKTAYVTNWNS